MDRELENFDLYTKKTPKPQSCGRSQTKYYRSSSILRIQSLTPDVFNSFNLREDDLQLDFRVEDPAYLTDQHLLTHTRISPFDREKLKSWLLGETNDMYFRQTYATASRFLDMFLMRRKNILRSDFQILGLACFVLASKIIESRIPAISYEVFDGRKLRDFEQTLMKVFHYKLNPTTYIDFAELITTFWDAYKKKEQEFQQVFYWRNCKKCLVRCRSFFQTLDCLDLIVGSLAFKLIDLVVETFYVENRRACLLHLKEKGGKLSLSQDAEFHDFHKEYSKQMNIFFSDTSSENNLKFQWNPTRKHLFFLVLRCSRVNPRIMAKSFQKFRKEILRQTYSEQISQIAKNILKKRS